MLRALFNALVPDCSLRLNNLRIPSYVLIKQLILNQLFTSPSPRRTEARSPGATPGALLLFGTMAI